VVFEEFEFFLAGFGLEFVEFFLKQVDLGFVKVFVLDDEFEDGLGEEFFFGEVVGQVEDSVFDRSGIVDVVGVGQVVPGGDAALPVLELLSNRLQVMHKVFLLLVGAFLQPALL
jgi:hypothetical protein